MKKKLSSRKGETILETLVALLIIALSVSFLSASIAKSTKIANDIKKVTEGGFTYDGSVKSEPERISATGDGITGIKERDVTVYKVPQYDGAEKDNLYYYYYEP